MAKGSGGGGKPGRTGGGEPANMPVKPDKIKELNQKWDKLDAERNDLLKKISTMSSKQPERKEMFKRVNQLRVQADDVLRKITEAGG